MRTDTDVLDTRKMPTPATYTVAQSTQSVCSTKNDA